MIHIGLHIVLDSLFFDIKHQIPFFILPTRWLNNPVTCVKRLFCTDYCGARQFVPCSLARLLSFVDIAMCTVLAQK